MFQTEIIIFFQSLGSDLLTFFFKLMSDIGRANFTMLCLIIIMFGINMKNGFIISWAVVWNSLLTNFFKSIFALPRPANVDSTVLLPGKDYPNPTKFKSMGANTFFGKLPQEVVDQLRITRIDSWGFPSGHSSNAITLWGFITLIFKNKWIRILSVLFILSIPLSRLYLGRHFLADILGGLILGLIITLLFYKFIYKNKNLRGFLFSKPEKLRFDLKTIMLITFLFIFPIILLSVNKINPEFPSSLLGLNTAFYIIRYRNKGFPDNKGTFRIRFCRVLITTVILFGLKFILDQIASSLSIINSIEIKCLIRFITISISIWISTEINFKIGFFKVDK